MNFDEMPYDLFKMIIDRYNIGGKDLISLCSSSKKISQKCNHRNQEIFRTRLLQEYGIESENPRKDYITYEKIIDCTFSGADIAFSFSNVLEFIDHSVQELGLNESGFTTEDSDLFHRWEDYFDRNTDFGFSQSGFIVNIISSNRPPQRKVYIPYKVSDIVIDPYGRLDWYSEILEAKEDQIQNIKLSDSDEEIHNKVSHMMQDWFQNVPYTYEGEIISFRPNAEVMLREVINFIVRRIREFKILARRAIVRYINGLGPEN